MDTMENDARELMNLTPPEGWRVVAVRVWLEERPDLSPTGLILRRAAKGTHLSRHSGWPEGAWNVVKPGHGTIPANSLQNAADLAGAWPTPSPAESGP